MGTSTWIYPCAFTPMKYEFIHLIWNSKTFKMVATTAITGETEISKVHIRVLGIQINTKFRRGPRVKETHGRMFTQMRALTKIAASTWAATFARARDIYFPLVRPVMTCGSTAWHSPIEIIDYQSAHSIDWPSYRTNAHE